MAALGVLTAGVAHEINNPLNYIMGGYVGLTNSLDTIYLEKDKRIKVFLQGIKEGLDRTANIVKGLNQLSRETKGFKEDCDIHTILDNCLTMLHCSYTKHVEIIKKYSLDSIVIKRNCGRLHQVFINIFSNSIDAIIDKGVIKITTERTNDQLVILVEDSGVGIPFENLSKIKDPFFTTKDPGKDTGLGLSISNTIIREHNGILDFSSELNKGIVVKVIFQLNKG